jgi:hypothetical protein
VCGPSLRATTLRLKCHMHSWDAFRMC